MEEGSTGEKPGDYSQLEVWICARLIQLLGFRKVQLLRKEVQT